MSAHRFNSTRFFLAAALAFALQSEGVSQPLTFTTVAGNAGYGSLDGAGQNARFFLPQGVASDPAGNVYVADSQNSTIRKIDSAGAVTTIAGLPGTTGSADGPGSLARFARPQGLAAGSDGTLFVADTGNSTIRMIATDGIVTTVAGSPGVAGSANGTNGSALFNLPGSVAVDAAGVLYVADTYNNTIRMLAPAGSNWVITTLAGSPAASGNTDGANSAALFYQPLGIAADANRSLYVADTGNGALRRITPSGSNWVVTTLANLIVATSIVC